MPAALSWQLLGFCERKYRVTLSLEGRRAGPGREFFRYGVQPQIAPLSPSGGALSCASEQVLASRRRCSESPCRQIYGCVERLARANRRL